jgi:hypothetical protein
MREQARMRPRSGPGASAERYQEHCLNAPRIAQLHETWSWATTAPTKMAPIYTHQPIFAPCGVRKLLEDRFPGDRTVDDDVSDMDCVACVFLCHRLREGQERARPCV